MGNKCFGETTSLYAIQKEGQKVADLKWKVLQDENLALSRVKVAKDDMVYLQFYQAGLAKDTESLPAASDQRQSVPSVYNFMSYVGTRFNEDSYEELLEIPNDDELGPMVRVIKGDDVPWV